MLEYIILPTIMHHYLLGLNQVACNVIVYFFYVLIFYFSFNLDVFFFFDRGDVISGC